MRFGDLIIQVVAGAAALTVVVIVVAIAIKLIQGAKLSMSTFGLSFLTGKEWNAVTDNFGAFYLILGTLITSVVALVLAVAVEGQEPARLLVNPNSVARRLPSLTVVVKEKTPGP